VGPALGPRKFEIASILTRNQVDKCGGEEIRQEVYTCRAGSAWATVAWET
jgi:hypothetical protein